MGGGRVYNRWGGGVVDKRNAGSNNNISPRKRRGGEGNGISEVGLEEGHTPTHMGNQRNPPCRLSNTVNRGIYSAPVYYLTVVRAVLL